MGQIRIDLPQANTLTIDDRNSNDRFDRGDVIRINGEVYRPNNLSCSLNENILEYFLNILGMSSVSQAGSLNAAARIFQTRHSALMEVHQGNCSHAEELLRESNVIAHEYGMPTSYSEQRPHLYSAYLSGLTTFYTACAGLDPTAAAQIFSLDLFEICDHPISNLPLVTTGEREVLDCPSIRPIGRGESEPVHQEIRGDSERVREIQTKNRRVIMSIDSPSD